MALWGGWGCGFADKLRDSLSVIYKAEFVRVRFDQEHGYFVEVEVTNQVRFRLSHQNSKGWLMELFKENKSGSRAKNFSQSKVVLISNQERTSMHFEVADRFVDEFEVLLNEESSLWDLYTAEAIEKFNKRIEVYRENRKPHLAMQKREELERLESKQKQRSFQDAVVWSTFGFIALAIIVGLANWF